MWRLGDEKRRAGGDLLEPVEHNARFVINGETRLPRDGIVEIPSSACSTTERDTGGEAVEISEPGRSRSEIGRGIEGGDATDLGETVASRQSPRARGVSFSRRRRGANDRLASMLRATRSRPS